MRSYQCILLLAIILIGAVAAQGQAPAAGDQIQQKLQAESSLVLVDTVVIDKKGGYIRDLTPKEFHVFEDNKEQEIKSVARETMNKAASRAPEHLVLYFGIIPVADQAVARNAALKFIDANASANRLIAIVNYRGSGGTKLIQGFTYDKERLRAALLAREADGSLATSGAGEGTIGSYRGTTMMGINQGEFQMRSFLHSIMSLSQGIAALPGRKGVIVLTPTVNYRELARTDRGSVGGNIAGNGTPPPDIPEITYVIPPDEMNSAIEVCNKAKVAIYTVDVQTNHSAEDNQYAPLAAGTGGFSIGNSRRIGDALAQIAGDQAERYVIAYAPAKSAKESCHKLKVKADRPGVIVRARAEYCNIDARDPLAGTRLNDELEARLNGSQAGDLTVQMRPAFLYGSQAGTHVLIAAEVGTENLAFEKQGNRMHGMLNVLGVALREDGSVAARFSDSVSFDFESAKRVEEFKLHPYHYEGQFNGPAGKYTLKVVFASDKDHFGRADASLEIGAWDEKKFALSGVVLSRESRKLAAPLAEENSLAGDRGPLISRDLLFIPAPGHSFSKTDSAMLYVEIFDPLVAKADPPKLRIQMLVIDKADRSVKVNSGLLDMTNRIRSENPIVPVGLRIPTENLPKGNYVLVLKASNSAGSVSEIRSTEFELQ